MHTKQLSAKSGLVWAKYLPSISEGNNNDALQLHSKIEAGEGWLISAKGIVNEMCVRCDMSERSSLSPCQDGASPQKDSAICVSFKNKCGAR